VLQGVDDGTLDDIVDFPGAAPAHQEAHQHGHDTINQAFAQFLEVVEEAHGGHFVLRGLAGEPAALAVICHCVSSSMLARAGGFGAELWWCGAGALQVTLMRRRGDFDYFFLRVMSPGNCTGYPEL
jgi:hypothetical protein